MSPKERQHKYKPRIRRHWKIAPVTRVEESGKIYYRPKEKEKIKKEHNNIT